MNIKDKELVLKMYNDLENLNNKYDKIKVHVFFDNFMLVDFNYDRYAAGKIGFLLSEKRWYSRPKNITLRLECSKNNKKESKEIKYEVSIIKEPIIEPTIINLTPEPINIITNKTTITFSPSGMVAKIDNKYTKYENTIRLSNGIEINDCVVDRITHISGVPDEEKGSNKIYIVPREIAELYVLRKDIRFPAKPVIKNNKIVGYRCLAELKK